MKLEDLVPMIIAALLVIGALVLVPICLTSCAYRQTLPHPRMFEKFRCDGPKKPKECK